MAGEVPYLDFSVEYPPLSLLAFTLPRVLAPGTPLSEPGYRLLFVLLMLATALLLGVVVLRAARRADVPPGRAALAFTAGALLLAPVALWRYDVVPALCTALALLAWLRGSYGWAGATLALGVAAKLYPAVAGPVFLAERLARRDAAGGARLVSGGLIVLLVTVLPFALIAPAGLSRVIGYHAERGVQVESLVGGVILLAARLGRTDATLVRTPGADELVSPWSAVYPYLPFVTTALLLVTAALAYARFRTDVAHARGSSPALVAYTALALLAFILTSKVLSPQFLVWLLPVLPLLPRRHARRLLGAAALTALLFPWRYWDILHLELPALLLLNARNGLLLLAAVGLVREYRPRGAAGSDLPPAERARGVPPPGPAE